MKLLAVPNYRKAIRANAIAGGFDDRECDRRSDGGVDCVTALLQHTEPGLCSERLRSSDNISCHYRHALGRVRKIVGETIHIDGDSKMGRFGLA